MKKNIQMLLMITIIISSCKPKHISTLEDILPKYQWRKTEKTIYNTNNKLEEYLFTFEDAEDCEKNSFSKYSIIYAGGYGRFNYYNLCSEKDGPTLRWNIKSDTLYIKPYNSDTISTFHFEKHINYYDDKTFILDYDTIINETNKKIKETFTAFPKN